MNWAVPVLIGVLLFLVGFQLFALLRARMARGRPAEGLTGELGRAVGSGGTVLAYFWSPSCGSCRAQNSVIDRLRKDFPNIVKINVAEDMAQARALKVTGTPSLVLLADGKVKEFLVGVHSETKLRALLRG